VGWEWSVDGLWFCVGVEDVTDGGDGVPYTRAREAQRTRLQQARNNTFIRCGSFSALYTVSSGKAGECITTRTVEVG
jgi:hypothetical protein